VESLTLVIFGITSNLAQIKLIPALYDITEKGLLPKKTHIIGVARSPQSFGWIKDYFHQTLHSENRHHRHSISSEVLKNLNKRLYYLNGNLDNPKFYLELVKLLKKIKSDNTIFYLATYPELYQDIFANLKKARLNSQARGFTRVMIEKPIGNNLSSSRRLNKLLSQYFSEDQIYRLDHYLGKETLQNILTFRFSNRLFEPLINNKYIDHIQITSSEDFGIGNRGGYYDKVGALKDVGQNHLLQLLAFALMESPSEFTNQEITRQRLKILQKLKPQTAKIVFGQYQGYLDEKNVEVHSKTDTYFALKTFINSNRFKSVPIYLRSGKKLAQTVTEVAIIFKHLPGASRASTLIYRIQPNEGIVLKILTKKPGHTTQLEDSYMQFCYQDGNPLPDAYEKLIADCIRGDQTFFNDAEEIEAQWKFIDPFFAKASKGKPLIYQPGSWGPKEADQLIQSDGREWLEPSMLFCKI